MLQEGAFGTGHPVAIARGTVVRAPLREGHSDGSSDSSAFGLGLFVVTIDI
jgi:hypothetical protein